MDSAQLLEDQIISTFHYHGSDQKTALVARLVCEQIRGPDYWRAVCLLKLRINVARDSDPAEFTRAGARTLLLGTVDVVGLHMIPASQFMRLQAVVTYYVDGMIEGVNGTIREHEVGAEVFQAALKDDVIYEMTRMLHKI